MAQVVSLKVWVELAIIFFICMAGVFFSSRYIGEKWAEFPYVYQEMQIVNEPRVGGYINMKVSVNRTKLCPQKFYREIYDGQGARVSQYQWAQGAKPVGPEEYLIRVPLPKEAEAGDMARLCVAQAPQCNLLQITLPYWTPLKCVHFKIKQ